MDCEQDNNSSFPQAPGDDESRSAVNSLILDYYKKFGRKRDLEQYFSLSTAQSDIRDPSSIFWSKMKTENESSDSGERSDNKKSDSSQEVCRISIRFPAHDPSTSQDEDSKTKTESTSPPIIIEELPQDSKQNSEEEALKSDDDTIKSDDNNSQKSYDVLLDTSLNKLHSPSSSITSQRKLEWDSLADVGYANESDRKTSASSLSTLERLALKQQYSNNDTQQDSNLGVPTAHSTPFDENERSKSKKGLGRKSTKIYNKDFDVVEVNVPHSSNMNPPQSINVNLTKHISFNVEKDGKVTVDNVLKDIKVSPEKASIETEPPAVKMDREMQTSLTRASNVSPYVQDAAQQKIPILISLNTLRSRVRRKRLRMARRKLKSKKRADKENVPVQDKSGEQLSEAESFEYMPGHIYNQNQMTANNRPANTTTSIAVDNKSSLESSGILTSESSKGSKHSFTKDLEKSIDLLKTALKQRCDDSTLRKQLIQQVCQRLMSSRYRDDESTTDFLSGLSFSSKKLGISERNNTTTSTSDANNSAEKAKRPKKSILRTDKFNAGSIASTSQSVPNLPVASKSENLVTSNLAQNLTTSNTESDMSSKEKTSSDNGHAKTSSEELYKKYLQALKREEAYKKHLKDKEMFLKQKLASSDGAFKVPAKVEVKPNSRLKDLINDLTRNNYDDGSGDASKLEGGPSSHRDLDRCLPNRAERSHSVFTLSSGISGEQNKKLNLKKKLQSDIRDLSKPGPSKESHYCCCPHHGNLKFADSSVQVNIKNQCSEETCPARQSKVEPPKRSAKIISDDLTGNVKYVCLCSKNVVQEAPEDFLIYKCSRLNNKGIQLEETTSKSSNEVYIQCNNETCSKRNIGGIPSTVNCLNNKSSQTNMLIKMLHEQPTNSSQFSGDQKHSQQSGKTDDVLPLRSTTTVYECTRWIQTEISINPKISEPTLSDINIVSDASCAKLISEHCREVPKSSLTDIFSNQAVASTSAFSDSCKSTGTSKSIGKRIKDITKYHETEKGQKENINQEANIDHSENFAIPIHGTNMTLMVSIGSEIAPFGAISSKNPKQMVTECIGTDKVQAIEQATSLREECSKEVQSDKISDESAMIDLSNESGDVDVNKSSDSNKNPITSLTAAEARFGTYPKTSPVNERKPFRRANTDTDKVQSNIITRNERVGESVASINCRSRRKSSDKSSEYNPNKQETGSYGCKRNKDNFRLISPEQKITQSKKGTLEKEMTAQPGSSNETYGFGLKDHCKEDSIKRSSRLTPRDQGQKESCDQKLTSEDFLLVQNETCSCGCGGLKNACTKSCNEPKLPSQKHCGTQPVEQTSTQTTNSLEKYDRCNDPKSAPKPDSLGKIKTCGAHLIDNHTNTTPKGTCGTYSLNDKVEPQTNNPLTENESCSCGCGGIKNKCKKSCEELKLYPTSNKDIDTQTDMFLTQNEMCQCGCDGLKEKCKRSCGENVSSPRNGDTEDGNPCKGQMLHRLTDISRIKDCGKQWLDKAVEIQTQTGDSLTKSEMCPCGCDGEKDRCEKSCTGLESTSTNQNFENKKQRGTQSNKEIETQTDITPNQTEKCSCDCDRPKSDCSENCREQQLSTRQQYKKQDQIVYTAAYDPENNNEKCPCECGGTKNTCKNNCQVTSTSRKAEKLTDKKEIGIQKNCDESSQYFARRREEPQPCTSYNTEVPNAVNTEHFKPAKKNDNIREKPEVGSSGSKKSSNEAEPTDSDPDPILNLIQNITKKYTKQEVAKDKRKKCFREIMTVLNYLLETDESLDKSEKSKNRCESSTTADETDICSKKVTEKSSSDRVSKKLVDKGVQPPKKVKSNSGIVESSEVLTSTDIPGTSSDSGACKVLNKIKNECDKYHQRRCKVHSGSKCDGTSSTSINCDQCRRVHSCQSRNHKCKNHKKSSEKIQKSPVAYNLILQTSESVMSEGPSTSEKPRTLKNIIVKVPKKKPHACIPFRELAAKFERQLSSGVSKESRACRSKSLPNESEISSMEEIIRQSQGATVREYLEKNRPEFIEKCSQRQTCMRYISESRFKDPRAPSNLKMVVVHTPNCPGNCNSFCGGVPNVPMTCMSTQCLEPRLINIETGVARIANERAAKRDLLSLHLAQLPDVTELDAGELRSLAAELGRYMRDRRPSTKFMSEREMKKHSEKIYKSLPEVVKKKEEQRRESIKKTNLLMAHMFKRNLQKKTLRGSVNLSNYSTVIKI